MLRCTVGALAYNEEQNISHVLHALLDQRLDQVRIVEIIVVASGCTDRTVPLAQALARREPLIKVDVQGERSGKAAAINRLIEQARGDVIALVGADTLPHQTALEQLVRPFADPAVGMTGARVVPLNDPRSFIGFATQMLWQVHHRMAVRWPKLGELVAFRNVVRAVPNRSATDEVSLEALISARGYRLAYTPAAIVYNRGPQTLGDFLHQRRRIYAGHLDVAATQRYIAASMPFAHLIRLVRESLVRDRQWMVWLVGAMLLEAWARLLGQLDWALGHSHHIWRSVRSTKQLSPPSQPLTLVAIRYRAGSLRRRDLMRALRRMPPALGAILWWDHLEKAFLCAVPSTILSHAALHAWIERLASYIPPRQGNARDAFVSYQIVACTAPGDRAHAPRAFEDVAA